MLQVEQTKWCNVSLVFETNLVDSDIHYWLQSDNGSEKYYGLKRPSDLIIEYFAKRLA